MREHIRGHVFPDGLFRRWCWVSYLGRALNSLVQVPGAG